MTKIEHKGECQYNTYSLVLILTTQVVLLSNQDLRSKTQFLTLTTQIWLLSWLTLLILKSRHRFSYRQVSNSA